MNNLCVASVVETKADFFYKEVSSSFGNNAVVHFLKVATTLVDLLFIEPVSHLSHVKQMYSQPIHLTQAMCRFTRVYKSQEEG